MLGAQHSTFGGQVPIALEVFVPDQVVTFSGGLTIPSPNENCKQTWTYWTLMKQCLLVPAQKLVSAGRVAGVRRCCCRLPPANFHQAQISMLFKPANFKNCSIFLNAKK